MSGLFAEASGRVGKAPAAENVAASLPHAACRAYIKRAASGADIAMAFWREKSIAEMTEAEWESLCDGCGLCCQIRVEDPGGGMALSDAACRLLDLCTHRCKDYANRRQKVPDCVKITPDNVLRLYWLPHSCAYRLVAFGDDLPQWHHLVCGDPERVHTEGPSMRGELVSEDDVEWED